MSCRKPLICISGCRRLGTTRALEGPADRDVGVQIRSAMLLTLASAAGLVLVLAACSPTPPGPAPVAVAPMPVSYLCPQLARAAHGFDALPACSMLAQVKDDYRVERRALKALHRLPEQRCP